MYRLRDPSAAIREATPPVLTDGFALVTELGSVAFVVVFLSVLYWLGDRETTATVIGYTLVGLAVVLALKELFALPRPPASVRAVAVEPGSHGFPSGHAIATTVVYGGLVLARDRLRDARYVVPALAVIGLVGLSRVVIGVHYLGDVLAGYAVGVAVLVGLRTTVGDREDLACLIAAAITVPALALTGEGSYALLGLGGSLGGAVAFGLVDERSLPAPSGLVGRAVLVAGGLAFAGGVFWIVRTVGIAPVAVLASAVLVAGIVVFPYVLDALPIASQ